MIRSTKTFDRRVVSSESAARIIDAPLPTATLSAVQEVLAQGRAANTVKTYQSAAAYWEAWYQLRFAQPLPLSRNPADAMPIEHVLQFVVDHVERETEQGLRTELPTVVDEELVRLAVKRQPGAPSLSTTLLRLAVLAKAHTLRELANPLEHPAVRELLKHVRRAYATRGHRQRPKKALPRAPLEAMLATCDDSLLGRRDRALLLFGWASGGRRRSEVAAATLDHLERVSEDQFVYRLLHSKTNQEGVDDGRSAKPIIGAAARALNDWLKAAQITDGRLFRSLRNGRVGASLTAHSVALIVKARAARAGLEGNYSGHSLRSGFVTEAGRQGKPLAEVMRLTGHRSVPQAMAYYQQGDVLNSPVADLLTASNEQLADT